MNTEGKIKSSSSEESSPELHMLSGRIHMLTPALLLITSPFKSHRGLCIRHSRSLYRAFVSAANMWF